MDHIILIENMDFGDATKTIAAGDRIIWQNNDAMGHSAVRETVPTFDTGIIEKGQRSEPVEFLNPTSAEGIEYHCRQHPFMRARIVVTP